VDRKAIQVDQKMMMMKMKKRIMKVLMEKKEKIRMIKRVMTITMTPITTQVH
jgi:hypothetical protein